jgi:transposase
MDESKVKEIEQRYKTIEPFLNERTRRLFAANEALALEWGGITLLSKITGLTRNTIMLGAKELQGKRIVAPERLRSPGGGRKSVLEKDPRLLESLDKILDPATRGDPESPLRWSSKSIVKLAKELQEMGHKISANTVPVLLKELGYSLQSNRKTQEGGNHPDRDQQFMFIKDQVEQFQSNNQPVISVDAKKKELVGDFKNNGKEYRPQGDPEKVRVHDFIIKDEDHGRVTPYGVYDLNNNTGWVNLGTDSDTSTFAVESIRRWYYTMGRQVYPEATEILVTADGGGSNGSRVKLWKVELQKLANETGLNITVCHFPPGTSKWNKIEHRLFSYISINWRGKPLVSHEVIVNLIASTTTTKGLRVNCELDRNKYTKGIKVTDKEMNSINITRHDFHGEWNYTILPQK